MRLQLIITLAMCFVILERAYSEEVVVQSLSDGACWYEQGEVMKFTSFNDKTQLKSTRHELDAQVAKLLGTSETANDWLIHCGGYGASFIVKTQVNGLKSCAWLKIDKGLLGLRSVGGLEESKSESCDGYVWGELIVGVRDQKQIDELQSESYSSFIQAITKINSTSLKITLHKTYFGKEQSVLEEIRKMIDLKYVELNFFQHPVGEIGSMR